LLGQLSTVRLTDWLTAIVPPLGE
jgi:hypothetical protein